MSEPPDAADGTSASGTWLELSVTADAEAVEAVSDILSRAAPSGVSIEASFSSQAEGLAARPIPEAAATLRAYLPAIDRGAADRAIAEVSERLGHLQAFGLRPIGELEVRLVHEEDWASAWKEHFPVLRVGRRVVIRPTWREHDPAPGDIVITLDPGMAFGTGLHPTTRLCLAGLERWCDAGLVTDASVLDVGCGSGILSLGAGLMGARSVRAIDTDPVAVDSARANAARAGLDIEVRRGSLPIAGGPFDLILANLVGGVLIELASELADHLRAGDGSPRGGGRLLASGIFIDREPEVRRALLAAGLRVVGRDQDADWLALDLERPGA